jgi:restriction system protein
MRRAPRQAWSADIFADMVDWRRFEAVVEALFAQAGFETKSQSHGADGGIDIWLHSRSQPGTPVSIVQCKHWSGRRVGVDKVRELRGVMAAHDIKRGQFATTSSFSDEAIAFARDNGINLLDVDGLLALIAKRTPEQQRALLAVAYEDEYWRPTCVNCGIKLTERTPRGGGRPFWGCANYPRCKTTMQMRPE